MTTIIEGATGTEQKFYLPTTNEVLESYQVEQQREWLQTSPRKLALSISLW